jgi:hypothetical protein
MWTDAAKTYPKISGCRLEMNRFSIQPGAMGETTKQILFMEVPSNINAYEWVC